jgi:hypothetical protein
VLAEERRGGARGYEVPICRRGWSAVVAGFKGKKVRVFVYLLILLGLGVLLWPQSVVASPSAVIESHSMWMDSIGVLHIFGEVRNTGDTWIQSVTITATLSDANGVAFGTEYTYLDPNSLPPGAVGGFNLQIMDEAKAARVRSYSLFVDFKVAPPLPTKLAITGVSDRTNSEGYLEVVGEVENHGDKPSVNTRIYGTFYDATGKVIYDYLYEYPGATIPPGGTYRFECGSHACMGVSSAEVTSRITRYSIIAESELYTSISELATSVTQSTTIAAPTSVTQSTTIAAPTSVTQSTSVVPQATSRTESPSTETTVASAVVGIPFGTLGAIVLVAAVVLASSALVLRRVKGGQAVLHKAVSRQAIEAEPTVESTLSKQVFISYSSEDIEPAMQICKLLEQRGIPCWITPRDVMPGRSYGEEIINAIENTSATVLVLSEHANLSVHVKNEIERAASKGKTIFPIRIREVQPSKALEFFISSAQWIDAFRPPLEAQIDALAGAIKLLKAGGK